MARLKIAARHDDKSAKITLELPAAVHRDLGAYAEILRRESGHSVSDPVKLIAPMLARFMATDRAFARSRKSFSCIRGEGIALSWRSLRKFRARVPCRTVRRSDNNSSERNSLQAPELLGSLAVKTQAYWPNRFQVRALAYFHPQPRHEPEAEAYVGNAPTESARIRQCRVPFPSRVFVTGLSQMGIALELDQER